MYTPGSVFKLVTAACVIENVSDISSWEYDCEEEMYINGVKISCPKEHGKVDFEEALVKSCNCAFAELSTKLTPAQLLNTAKQFKFGESFSFGNSVTEKSILDLEEASNSDFAWCSVGQYTTLVNPYHMLTIAGAIANDGTAKLPFVVKSIASPSGRKISEAQAEEVVYISPETASELKKMMRNTVKDNYGDWNFGGVKMCGKTGTAEVSETKNPHSWFLGFCEDEKTPLAIVVVVENGGWGSSTAIPVASEVILEGVKNIK
ncbi:MAG: hypothetical protein IIW72_02325 [Clostridia bacterium]|nr:hypothetical protein [Clostridia bacterium]